MAEYVFVDLPLMPRAYGSVPLRPTIRNTLNKGNGYLAGEFPGGTTTVEGAPVSATVRVLLRTESGHAADGDVVAEVQSAPDGTWIVPDVPVNRLYDVVGRKEGFNDIVVAAVTPTSMVDITYTGDITINETFTGALGYLDLVGGIPPYAASVVDPLPAGIFPVVNGRQLIIDGTTTDDDVFNSTVRITSSNGVTRDVPVKLVVGFKAPANFEAETIEDAGAFSVVLTWGVTNSTQEVLVFKSATPFDLESMPPPIATLTGNAVSYTDDDVIEDDVFYYMVASVCEGFTLYSDEVREFVATGDPHWDKVVALLHFDGDLSDETGRVWTPNGGAHSENSGGVWGGSLSISQSPVSFLSTPKDDMLLGSEDFTIEFFYNHSSPSVSSICGIWGDTGLRSYVMYYIRDLNNQTYFQFSYSTNGSNSNNVVANIIDHITYPHVAICRDSNKLDIFIDGILRGSSTIGDSAFSNPSGNPLFEIGAQRASGNYGASNFNMDEFRITKGVARYTENFTPPTAQFPNK